MSGCRVCKITDCEKTVVRTPVAHPAAPRVPMFLFLPLLDFICELLLNKHTASWDIFVNSASPTPKGNKVNFKKTSHIL